MSLQGIGTFTLDIPLPEVTSHDKPVIIPANAVSFHYDPKIVEDETIVDFIVEHTKKIKPLASADLDSFLTLGRQFLNIGKPFTIQNLGTLDKLKSGELAFKPGQLILQKLEAPREISENDLEENDADNLFNDYQKESRGTHGKRVLLVVIILLIAGAGGWAAWNFLIKNNDQKVTTTDTILPVVDSPLVPGDSRVNARLLADSNQIASKLASDSVPFNIVVRTTRNKQVAITHMALLKSYGRNVIMYTKDSITYEIAQPFDLPLSDTAKLLDSLNRNYYRGKAFIELR
ncbi:MAG: hypothetical protein M3Z92_01145 [Bacteroidota bacterium]|nr:hypothetical protein [Bacteroidota bacterium]